jgi:Mce-associated membrane protein
MTTNDEDVTSTTEPEITAARWRRYVIPGLAALAIGSTAATPILAVKLSAATDKADQLVALQADTADKEKATEVARGYVTRSLTYNYNNVDPFLAAVQEGAADQLANKWKSVSDVVRQVIIQAQVVSSGESVREAVESGDNGSFKVTVFATQKVQNIQQPEPATMPILLSVSVIKKDGTFLVSDFGPQDGGNVLLGTPAPK